MVKIRRRKCLLSFRSIRSIIQYGDENCTYATLEEDRSLETITLKDALNLTVYPKKVGLHNKKPVEVCKGRFGLYVKYDGNNYSAERILIYLKQNKRYYTFITIPKSIGKIKGEDVVMCKGDGLYVKYYENNYSIAELLKKKTAEEIIRDIKKLVQYPKF